MISNDFRESFKLLLKALRKDAAGVRLGIAANVACGVVGVALSLLFVWLTREIVAAAVAADTPRLNILSMTLCSVIILRLAIAKCGQRIEAWCITRFSNKMRATLFARIMTGGGYADEELHSADVVNRMSADVGSVSATVCSTFPSAIVAAVSLAGAFIFLATISPLIAVVVTMLMPLAIIIGKATLSRTRRLTRQIREKESEIVRHMQESISHRLLVATLGYARQCGEEFKTRQSAFFRLTMRRNDLTLFSGGMVSLGFMAGYAVMFLYCAYGICSGAVSFATMTALLQLVAMVQRPAVELSHKITPVVNASVAMERIREIEMRYAPANTGVNTICTADEFRLENVWFRYKPSDDYVLRDFSATLPLGGVTVVNGETGIGKTTLLRLLLRLCRPESGRIHSPFVNAGFDDVVYIPQGNTLMSGTVMSNLLMGKPDATQEEIGGALHAACADFATRLPDGLLTRCGENGYGFSGGEAQRICIARGLLRLCALRKWEKDCITGERENGGILLLLDEPTSSLDADTESEMLRRLFNYARGATIVVVSHKTAVQQYADKLIAIQKTQDNWQVID